ncbi:MAG: hypothetical protein RJA07_2832 [Bacteroidota bacterium]|jgi:Spy/CpxP family protein refolding chaperone
MKKIIVLAALALSSQAFAQQTAPTNKPPMHKQMDKEKKEMPSAEQRAKKRSEHMAKELTLSTEQQDKVYSTLLSFMTKRDALQAKKETMKKDDFRKDAKSLEAERDNSLKAILTPEQFEKHQKQVEEEKQKHKGEGHKMENKHE